MTTIDKELEKEFFDSLEEKLGKADIAFRAYERGKNDMLSVINDIKAEIKKSILDEPVENGTNSEMACYNGGILTCLEIIDKHLADMRGE